MAGDRPPELVDAGEVVAYAISPGDTVRLAPLLLPRPDHDASVFLEIWEPGGSQPANSHPRSVETFFFLAGDGTAFCDDSELPVRAGQLLVLPPRSLHRIANTGAAELLAITTMSPDDGFAALVLDGIASELEARHLAVLGWQPKGAGGDAA